MEISLKLRTRTLDFSNFTTVDLSTLEKILFNQKSDSVNDTPQMVK